MISEDKPVKLTPIYIYIETQRNSFSHTTAHYLNNYAYVKNEIITED